MKAKPTQEVAGSQFMGAMELPKYQDLNPRRAWLRESSSLFAVHSNSGGGSLQPQAKDVGSTASTLWVFQALWWNSLQRVLLA